VGADLEDLTTSTGGILGGPIITLYPRTRVDDDIAMNKCSLTFVPTVVAGERLTNDYSVLRDQHQLVGRIRMLDERTWEWAISVFVPELSSASGTEKTFERARNALMTEWVTFHKALMSVDAAIGRKPN
jgi:hypothetical protein